MKKEIHPKYYEEAKIVCACGNVIETGATKEEMHIEICNACHPFYTGKEKLIDSAGQVDRFKKRMEQSTALKEEAKKKKVAKKDSKKKNKTTAKKKESGKTKK